MASETFVSPDLIVRILENQGYRELVSAHLFAVGVPLAPTIDDKHMLADHAREELAHFEVVSALYEQVAERALYDTVAARVSSMPSPRSWLESAVAGYLVDRAAAVQLLEYKKLGDTRLNGIVLQILEHEHEHQTAAETALRDQCRRTKEASKEAERHVAKWYPLALGVLDDNGEDGSRVAGVFGASVRSTLAECGVTLTVRAP